MADHWARRRWSSGEFTQIDLHEGQSEYDYSYDHAEQPLYTNPPPPLYYPLPPPCYPATHPTPWQYPDPQGVSPPAGPVLDYSDYSSSRPGSSLSQSSTHTHLYSPSISTTTVNSYSRCPFCCSVLTTSSLSTHLASTHSSLMFHCRALSSPGSVCDQQFLSVPQLRSHLYTQHMVTTFSCDKLSMAGTIILPSDLRLYRCKRCPAEQGTFYGPGPHLMAAHLASHHPEVTGPAANNNLVCYECRACDKYQLEDETHLLKHIKLRHSRTREPSVELLAGPLPQSSPSPEYMAPDSPGARLADPSGMADPSTSLTRCNMCPSPGLLHKDQIKTHQKSHNTALFTCAPCKQKFELYQDVESHIELRHRVSLASSIRESIIMPTREQLVTLQCGVCERQFVGQVEQVLTSHIETTHGKYYVGVGGGKNLLRLCRICGELGSDGGEMLRHLDSEHAGELFAGDSDNESTQNANIESISVTNKTTSNKVAFMDIFKEEVARRKAEYDKQEVETKRLRKILNSDSCSSEEEVEEVKIVKRKRHDNKKKKSRKYSSISEEESLEELEVKRKCRKRSKSSDEEDPGKGKQFKQSGKQSERKTVDKVYFESKSSTKCFKEETEKRCPESSDDSVPYKYQKYSNKSSKNDLQKTKYVNMSSKDDAQKSLDLLKQSSTEKLLEAKEMVRLSIQKEEGKQKEASVGAGSFEDDLKRMKQQLAETLKRSRELTSKVKKRHSSVKSSSSESDEETKAAHVESENEGIAPRQSKHSKPKSPRDKVNGISQITQKSSVPHPKLSKFKMTWKKK